MNYLYISGNTPSLKNSKQIVKVGNMPRLIPSKAHQKYAKASKKEWLDHAEQFKKMCESLHKPLHIGFYFVRDSRRKFDYDNAISTCLDLMVEHGWLEDDNADEVKPIPIDYEVDKERAGVYIKILEPLNIEKP
jgi:Holliday junction resolvase RusA-like endonuclease